MERTLRWRSAVVVVFGCFDVSASLTFQAMNAAVGWYQEK